MNWDYSLFDAVQLMIPIFCFFLTFAVVIIYLFLYGNFQKRIYSTGFLFSLTAMFFVLFESLVIICGWLGLYESGRIFHFVGQMTASYFMYTILLFSSALMDRDNLFSRIVQKIAYIGLGVAVVLTIVSLIKPALFISLTQAGEYGYLTPGNFARGKEGILLSLRDLFMGFCILVLIFMSIISLVINRVDVKTILIASGNFFATFSAIDDLVFFHFGRNFYLNNFRYSRLSVGLSLMSFVIMIAILTDYIMTQNQLVLTHDVLQSTHNRLKLSEQKYRRLAEGADQAVFSLSSDYRFISYNKKARFYFHLSKDGVNASLPDILGNAGGRETKGVSRQIILEQLRNLSRDMKSVRFHSIMNDLRTGEPEELEFHIDYFETDDGEVEYICRAERMKANRLIRCIEQEKLQLSLENYIIAIDDVTTRLTSALNKYMDSGSALMIKMGLQEIIINAIEHGNLNITFEEKSRALNENRYLDFIRERQMDSRYKDRMVRINYVLNKDAVQYMVTDEGRGFDFNATMRMVDSSVEQDFLPHGRGINMSRVLFDKVKYNSKGNQVLLVKKFEK
ncbi:ATP-binding protein [Oceanispirochaeta sp.]|jgi:PAS domain-containing protein|uniref:ATP-binding protein n=1 Tax=Oceanispirochaeta sp. TaxID=2035350 RepID=UPI00262226BF|nr:ATP-binding protein [Oceanispirochaeta sp.]MDA3956316.1 ATP-binding protein [Oceanispirochaeta sp.]